MEVCASSIAASSAFACFDASGPQRALFYHAVLAENAVNHILVGALKSALQNSVHIVFCNGPILGTDHVGKFVVEFCADLVLRPAEQRCQITRQELRGENILYMSPDAAPDSYGDAFFIQRLLRRATSPTFSSARRTPRAS